jgi:thiol-disulfide isomerase/thioredoxin
VAGALERDVTGVWALLGALVVATAIGWALRHRDGRFRPARRGRTHGLPASVAGPAGPPSDAGHEQAAGNQTARTSGTDPSATAARPAAGSTTRPLLSGPPTAPDATGQPSAPGTAGQPPEPGTGGRATGAPAGGTQPGSLAAELAALGQAGGERATLLQFSTAFCAPCRTTRAVLAEVARVVPGVAHVEVDAEAHLDLVRRLGVRRTPTVLVLDGAAREVSRASGAPPSRAAVIAALGPAAALDQ